MNRNTVCAIGITIFHIETFFIIETREIFTHQLFSSKNFSSKSLLLVSLRFSNIIT